MRLRILVGLLVLGGGIALGETMSATWDFQKDQVGAPPTGFSFGKTGRGRPGRWVVVDDASAPSGGHVLAQVDTDTTDYRFPVAVANEPLFKDVRLEVRCKPVSGKGDQACGLVFRYRDENNYYVARANALEDNVRLYHVVNGNRRQFAGWNGNVVIDAKDDTFKDAGKVGVWTKADSVTHFAALSAKPLG